METLLPGIRAERVPTGRLTVAMLSVPARTGPPVLFVHGNVSSSLFWQPTMLALPEPFRPLAIDLRGFGDTDPEPVDARRGLRDYADDLAAVIEALGLEAVHLVGWSMGGGVVLQYLADRAGSAPGGVPDAGGSGVPVRLRRYPRPRRHALRSVRRGVRWRNRQPGLHRPARGRRPQ